MTIIKTESEDGSMVDNLRLEPISRDAINKAFSAENWPVVIVESPFAGDMEANRKYMLEACADCMRRGEVPFASHGFFPQFLDELTPEERELGLTAGYAFWPLAKRIIFYLDRGWSKGMLRALDRAKENNITVSYRYIADLHPRIQAHP